MQMLSIVAELSGQELLPTPAAPRRRQELPMTMGPYRRTPRATRRPGSSHGHPARPAAGAHRPPPRLQHLATHYPEAHQPLHRGNRRLSMDPRRPPAGGEGTVRCHHRPRLPDPAPVPAAAQGDPARPRRVAGDQLRAEPVALPRPLPAGASTRLGVELVGAKRRAGGIHTTFGATFE